MQSLYTDPSAAIRFDEFVLYPQQRLMRGTQPVRLGGLALRLLSLLVQKAGEFVQTEEILRGLWPRGHVAEATLRVHLASLRKALGDGCDGRRYVVNVHSRGYSFVGRPQPFSQTTQTSSPLSTSHREPPVLWGAGATLEQVAHKLGHRRLVTLVGPPGVGKSALAFAAAVAWRERERPRGRILHVDLHASCSSDDVLRALLQAIDPDTDLPVTLQELGALASVRDGLLWLDGCDRVLAEVADFVERLVGEPGIGRVLVTSREPLRIDAECLQRVVPLDITNQEHMDRAEFPAALDLFFARRQESGATQALAPLEIEAAWQICCLLDGMPHAILQGAALAARIGVLPTLQVLTGAILPTGVAANSEALANMADWRWPVDDALALLTPTERQVCLQLVTLEGTFDLAAATAAVPWLQAADAIEVLTALVDKSLVQTHFDGDRLGFHLLGTTRARALHVLLRPSGCPRAGKEVFARAAQSLQTLH